MLTYMTKSLITATTTEKREVVTPLWLALEVGTALWAGSVHEEEGTVFSLGTLGQSANDAKSCTDVAGIEGTVADTAADAAVAVAADTGNTVDADNVAVAVAAVADDDKLA